MFEPIMLVKLSRRSLDIQANGSCHSGSSAQIALAA